MCKGCVEAVQRVFPEVPEDRWGDLLWGATAFPFADPPYIENQLRHMREIIDRPEHAEQRATPEGIVHLAMGIADREMSEAMDRYRDQAIRELAYFKWQAAGCPEGRDLEFWFAGRKEYYSDGWGDDTPP